MSSGSLRAGVFAAATAAMVATGAAFAAEAASSLSEPSRIAVDFVRPEAFTDAKASAHSSGAETASLLADLARFVSETGERFVARDRSLAIRVTDIDLAGEFEPWRGPQFEHTRFMREVYPPRIALEFELTGPDGRVLASGARILRDPLYLARSIRLTNDPLRYEKRLIEDWFREEFAK
jgi:hypothetical protein